MECETICSFSYDQLRELTDDFSQGNYIGTFQFGKIYRGKIKSAHEVKDVLVKIWGKPEIDFYYEGDNELRCMDELIIFRHEKLTCHPGMIKLLGYVQDEEHLGAVYDFKPLDTVYNLTPRDNFTWLQRIKVAFGFASLLKFLHKATPQQNPFVLRNISASHIVIDEEYNPKLFDVGLITGGVFPDRTQCGIYFIYGCMGYVDLSIGCTGEWNNKSDVFSFGVLLLNLITKRIFTKEDRKAATPLPHRWAWNQYAPRQSDSGIKLPVLVHQSLTADPDYCRSDGRKLTKLAMKCVGEDPEHRPDMKKIVNCLLKLRVIKQHADYLGKDILLHAQANLASKLM
ncbi:hypothetical protein ACH5RR_037543 [Cinchona calisaya]|uniref:Protein kinase domain-containing protein n=1 Tax=Cinchona calisaya TaxID=153742 RepID=A0ABD2YA65_9GENT